MATSTDSPQLTGPLDYPRSCSLNFFYFPEFLPISYEVLVGWRADTPGTLKQPPGSHHNPRARHSPIAVDESLAEAIGCSGSLQPPETRDRLCPLARRRSVAYSIDNVIPAGLLTPFTVRITSASPEGRPSGTIALIW